MKKLGIVVGILLSLLIAAIVIVPLVVDVDKYRPQIIDAVNQRMNGKLDLGKLSLSLWGQVRVEVNGLKLTDLKGNEVVAVNHAFFHLPFLPLLSGSPEVTFKMDQPVMNVIKSRTGELNVMSLMKTPPQGAGTQGVPSATATPAPQTPPAERALPPIVTRARLGVELNSAQMNYADELTGFKTNVSDLNLKMKDISLSHPTEFEVWADLNTRMGNLFHLRGPARLTGKATPELLGDKVDKMSLTMLAQFLNAEVSLEGSVAQLSQLATAAPILSLKVKSNEIGLKPWVEVIPMLKAYELGGAIAFEADAGGPTDKLDYHGKLSVKDMSAKAPQLKAQPHFDGVVNLSTDQIESFLLTMKAPGNDLKVQGKVVSFSQPKANFEVTSTGMDLDQLVEFPAAVQPESKGTKSTSAPPSDQAKAPQGSSPAPKAEPKSDYDAMLAPLRDNKVAAATTANFTLTLPLLKAKGIKLTDVTCRSTLKSLVLGMDDCGFKVFSGKIKTDGSFQLGQKTPTYRFDAQVADLDLTQAIASQMALFKDTLTGRAHFSIKGQGASFNPDPALSNLKAMGNMKVENAVFATIDVMKMVSEALVKTINQIGEKIPAAKGKSIGALPSKSSRYSLISSSFTIEGGQFSAPDFVAKAVPNEGIDLKGSTKVGMKTYALESSWEIIDTYNLTRAKDLSIEQNGVKVEHLLAEGNSPVHFPIHIGCTLMAPCYSYAEVPGFLLKIALKNMSSALGSRANEEVRKRAESLMKQAPPALQEKLKGLFGR